MKMLLAAMTTVAMATPALAEDDTPTRGQRASVMTAVRAAGCTSPTKIERDDGLYDLKLSADFKIVSHDKDDND